MTPEELKTRRMALGLSQERLAELLDVRRPTVSDWERGAWPVPKTVELALWAIEQGQR